MNNVISIKSRTTTPDPEGADMWLAMIGMLPQEDDFLDLINNDLWGDDGDVDWDLLEEQALEEPDRP